MSHDPSGRCIVCDITTAQRCSSCSEHGFDLFLCGREHQKLIWSAHKRVCGVNSNPFRFPPLSPEKVEEAEKRGDEVIKHHSSIRDLLNLFRCSAEGAHIPKGLSSLAHTQDSVEAETGASVARAIVRSFLYLLEAAPYLRNTAGFQPLTDDDVLPPSMYDPVTVAAALLVGAATLLRSPTSHKHRVHLLPPGASRALHQRGRKGRCPAGRGHSKKRYENAESR